MPTFRLEGFNPTYLQFKPATAAIVNAIFVGIGYPPLRSDVVRIISAPDRPAPMYCAGINEEIILINVFGNYPWQYSYQLSHEMGHLSARGDLRFSQKNEITWIEEALCEAHSLIAMRRMAENADDPMLRSGAIEYDRELHSYYRDVAINRDWFLANADLLRKDRELTDRSKAIARYIFDLVPHDRILSDNRLLINLDTHVDLSTFLDRWTSLGGYGTSVPSTLRDLL